MPFVPATPIPEVRCFKDVNAAGYPSFGDMTKSVSMGALRWIVGGFGTVSDEVLQARLETCRNCEFWDSKGFMDTGRCRKCGCSTKAKLRMPTEKCPIGKWGAEDIK